MFVDTEHKLEHAFDGSEAVEQIKGGLSVDVILLDWEMPNMSGVEALKALRALGCNIPILMVTSKNNVNNIAKALESGANEYIMKPLPETSYSRSLRWSLVERWPKMDINGIPNTRVLFKVYLRSYWHCIQSSELLPARN